MATNSTQTGFLAPSEAASYDVALEDQIQATVAGITGLAGEFVRPRWQVEPANRPAFDTDWVAFGINRVPVDAFAFHKQDDEHADVERDELLYVLHSFYGPHCHALCERFRDGFEVGQNRSALKSHGIELVEVQEAVHLPALLKEKWVQRVDVQVTYRRRTSRRYPILTITSATAQLDTEVHVTPLTVNND